MTTPIINKLTLLAMALPFVLAGCIGVHVKEPSSGRPLALTLCAAGEQLQQKSTLYFGADIASGGSVDALAWQAFVATEVTPRFADGLTWFAAHGQWRDGHQQIVREDSRVIILLHDGKRAARKHIDAIAAAYRKAFAQQSVLEERSAVCMRLH